MYQVPSRKHKNRDSAILSVPYTVYNSLLHNPTENGKVINL